MENENFLEAQGINEPYNNKDNKDFFKNINRFTLFYYIQQLILFWKHNHDQRYNLHRKFHYRSRNTF
jgi:hypothetical protein